MAPNVTLCTVAFNGLEAASLMWESYNKYHERPLLYVYENGSTDGTADYLKERADFMWVAEKNDYHGWGLDRLCNRVETEYTLTVDTDVEFHKPTVPMMIAKQAFAVHQCRWYGPDSSINERRHYERPGPLSPGENNKVWGLMVWATLFKTKELQKLLKHISFTTYINQERQEIYDTGALLNRVALASGLSVAEVDLVGEGYLTHYWNVTNANYVMPEYYDKNQTVTKYDIIKSRLASLRSEKRERVKSSSRTMFL